MDNNRLFSRNFTLMTIGQIISLFGNATLRFALSLYVLDLTGSAAVFGGILALSMIPTVLLSPFGGMMADRVPRQKIMWGLDFITAALLVGLMAALTVTQSLAVITAAMMLLAVIQAFYQPSVTSSVPLLVDSEHLMAANGVVVQVQALAGLLGPILGGFLYGMLVPQYGLWPILAVSAVCFFLSAVMELFIRIPFTKQERSGSGFAQVKADFGGALRFLTKENPGTAKLLLVVAGLNLFLAGLFMVGVPFLVKIYLGLSAELYGFAEAALGCGSIAGGIASAILSKKVGLQQSYRFLLVSAAAMLPIVGALVLGAPAPAVYGVIVGSILLGMAATALFNIAAQTFLQQETPIALLGKVTSLVTVICVCALPVGQALYGFLFEVFRANPWPVVLFGAAVSLLLSVAAKRPLAEVGKEIIAAPAMEAE